MANDINLVVLLGHLTRDPEIKYTNTGAAVLNFSIAVNRRKKSGDSWTDEVSYFDIQLWGKAAEILNNYLSKGKQVAIKGELRQSRWTQDGQSRSKVYVNAETVQMLSDSQGGSQGKNKHRSQGTNQNQQNRSSSQRQVRSHAEFTNHQNQPPQDNGYAGPEFFDDDIPF